MYGMHIPTTKNKLNNESIGEIIILLKTINTTMDIYTEQITSFICFVDIYIFCLKSSCAHYPKSPSMKR